MACSLPAELLALAASQGGCFTVAQAAAHGRSTRQLRVLESRGLLLRCAPKVTALVGSDPWQRGLWSAVLQIGGAVVSHESAGRLLGFPALPPLLSVTVPRDAHPRPLEGVRVHRCGPVPGGQVAVVDGLTVTSIERTVVDLAGEISRARLGFVVDDLLAGRRTSLVKLGGVLAEVRRRGRVGGATLASLLDERAGRPTPRSLLEQRLDDAIAAAGLGAGIAEYPLPGTAALTGFVDRAFPEARLILEADGRRWHTRTADYRRDRQRDRHAAMAGWQTVRIAWEELETDAPGVAAELRAIYLRRLAA